MSNTVCQAVYQSLCVSYILLELAEIITTSECSTFNTDEWTDGGWRVSRVCLPGHVLLKLDDVLCLPYKWHVNHCTAKCESALQYMNSSSQTQQPLHSSSSISVQGIFLVFL